MIKRATKRKLAKSTKRIFYPTFITLIFGCANVNANSYEMQLKNYCTAHSTEYWDQHAGIKTLQTMDANAKMALFREHIHKTIESEELKTIIFEEGAYIVQRLIDCKRARPLKSLYAIDAPNKPPNTPMDATALPIIAR